jgi:hypothetical protein
MSLSQLTLEAFRNRPFLEWFDAKAGTSLCSKPTQHDYLKLIDFVQTFVLPEMKERK